MTDDTSSAAGVREYVQARHLVTCCLTAVVAWGAWNAQTDCYPINESQARPSWYVYGWPLCFATSSRGRLNFSAAPFARRKPFDCMALAIDLAIMVVLILSTVFTVESLLRRSPRISILDLLAITAGIAIMLFVLSGGHHKPLEWLTGAIPPWPGHSADTGNFQPISKLNFFVAYPLSLGLVSVGFAIVELPFCLRRSSSPRVA